MIGRVVVVGGGFAGFWAAMAARRVGRERVGVTLVSREPVLQMRPRLYEANPEELAVDLLPLLARTGVEFVEGEAVGVDVVGRSVELAAGEVRYDRLVVATGSCMRRPSVPGADEAFSIDTQAEAIVFDRRLAEVVRATATPVVAVVGAGFTGIELALELRDRIACHGDEREAERARILLVDRAEVVGHRLGPGPRPLIEAALSEARVELLLGVTVTGLSRDRLALGDGTTVAADAVVLTTGMEAAPFVGHLPGAHDELKRLLVERTLRAPAAPDVFVAGDAAAATGADGQRVLQSCQHALQLGRFAGENATRDLLSLPTREYVQPPYITCLDLGRAGAVFTRGWERRVDRVGGDAKRIKRRINTEVIYPPADAPAAELLALSSLDPARQTSSRLWERSAAATSRMAGMADAAA